MDTTTNTAINENFDGYKNAFVERLWEMYPGWATEIGYHKYDGKLMVNDEAYRNRQLLFVKAEQDSLAAYDMNKISDLNKIDAELISNFLKSTQWNIEKLRYWEWDPSSYNACGGFSYILSESYASLEERLSSLNTKLEHVPAFYDAAKKNITNSSIEHTQLAIDQNLGGVAVFETDILDSLKVCKLDDVTKKTIKERCKLAATAVHGYVDHLKTIKNDQPRGFRLGQALYPEKFAFDIQSEYSSDQIYNSALERKKYLHEQMFSLSKLLWPTYCGALTLPSDSLAVIRKMIDTLSIRHTTPQAFQSTIEKQIPELEAFIKAKNLIYIDPAKPLKVRKEPAYMAGVAGVSISAPGPYDKNGNTYYNVGSLANYSKEQAESYLREYNDYILQILNIHEAIPGHYTQLVYSNNSPSIIKSVFGNGAMIEGWAVYGEIMMLENGYGSDPKSKSTEATPEMWLMYYKWNLRAVCNTILDIGVHSRNMTKEEALTLLTQQAFQQTAEAEGKWKRVTLTSVQLCSYYTGFKEICDLREEYRKKMGDKFNLKEFHEKFLSYGSSPVKFIREMMLKQ